MVCTWSNTWTKKKKNINTLFCRLITIEKVKWRFEILLYPIQAMRVVWSFDTTNWRDILENGLEGTWVSKKGKTSLLASIGDMWVTPNKKLPLPRKTLNVFISKSGNVPSKGQHVHGLHGGVKICVTNPFSKKRKHGLTGNSFEYHTRFKEAKSQ